MPYSTKRLIVISLFSYSLFSLGDIRRGDLVRATAEGDLTLTRKLLMMGADINENVGTEENQITPLLTAIVQGHKEVAKYLINWKQRPSPYPSFEGYSAIDYAWHLFGDTDELVVMIRGLR